MTGGDRDSRVWREVEGDVNDEDDDQDGADMDGCCPAETLPQSASPHTQYYGTHLFQRAS